ncbi:MAG: nucleotide-binding protein [Proteobacteria bacterium]|nr:nucleotide-binding protein [Pseudomonadota bacterium]MBU1741889.1 nucleotide-binding protein [Pseudomonadota bacterium]
MTENQIVAQLSSRLKELADLLRDIQVNSRRIGAEGAEFKFNAWREKASSLLHKYFKQNIARDFDMLRAAGISSTANNPFRSIDDSINSHQQSMNSLIEMLEESPDLVLPDAVLSPPLEMFSEETDVAKFEEEELSKKVFIAFGRDVALTPQVEVLLKDLELEPIIMESAAYRGKTNIGKFEGLSGTVGCAIVLFTADDLGCTRADYDEAKTEGFEKAVELLKPRARQNVVWEHGFFCGLMSRSKVIALVAPGVELFSNIDGLGRVTVDNSEKWKASLIKELREIYTLPDELVTKALL